MKGYATYPPTPPQISIDNGQNIVGYGSLIIGQVLRGCMERVRPTHHSTVMPSLMGIPFLLPPLLSLLIHDLTDAAVQRILGARQRGDVECGHGDDPFLPLQDLTVHHILGERKINSPQALHVFRPCIFQI